MNDNLNLDNNNSNKSGSSDFLLFALIAMIVLAFGLIKTLADKKEKSSETKKETIETQKTETQITNTKPKEEAPKLESPLKGKLIISKRRTNTNYNVENEYLILKSNANRLNITDWTIISFLSPEKLAFIPQAKSNFYLENKDIILEKNENVYIHSGKSPAGNINAFEETICNGFFTKDYKIQNYKFKTRCPEIEITILDRKKYSSECIASLEAIKPCQAYNVSDFNGDDFLDCYERARPYVHYESCIEKFKNDKNFYYGTWHIFLNLKTTHWKNKEDILIIFDKNNSIVDQYEYK